MPYDTQSLLSARSLAAHSETCCSAHNGGSGKLQAWRALWLHSSTLGSKDRVVLWADSARDTGQPWSQQKRANQARTDGSIKKANPSPCDLEARAEVVHRGACDEP